MLGGGLGLGLLMVLYLTWSAPEVLPFVPLVLLAGVALWVLFRHPLLNLSVALAGFALVADNEAGFQLREILYGLYLYGVLGHWFVTRLFVYRERILHTAEDKALFLFLLLLPCTIPLTYFFGGDFQAMTSQLIALALFAVYFPVKEACARYRYGTVAMLAVVCGVAAAVALRNLLNYQQLLLQATQTWQIERGRVSTNDNLLMVGSLFGLTLVVFARRWWSFGLLLGAFLTIFAGLILTQSRGYWVAFLLGAFAMFVVMEWRYKQRMVVLAVTGLVGILGAGFLFFGEYMTLLLGGLVERFATLQTAATKDLSLVNRWRETAVAWEHVAKNPILGYGMGVKYLFYDITRHSTDYDDLVHNGYLGLWYKFGLWGLGLILFFWVRTIWHGIQAFRIRSLSTWTRVCGLAGAACLVAFTLSTITSNPFYLKDSLFIFSLVAGVAAGAYHRAQRVHRPEAPS